MSIVDDDADGRTDGRRLNGYTISSPCEPNGSGELKNRHLPYLNSEYTKLYILAIINNTYLKWYYNLPDIRGARWLSGRAADSGARGRRFETYMYLRRVVSLIKVLYFPKSICNIQEAVAPSRYDYKNY